MPQLKTFQYFIKKIKTGQERDLLQVENANAIVVN